MADRVLEDRVAIITGGGRGIGRVCAIRAAQEGASIVIADISGDLGEAVAQEINDVGGIAISVQTDVSDASSVSRMVAEVSDRFGRLDLLHNNAAITDPNLSSTPNSLELEESVFDQVVAVNLKGVWLCSKSSAGLLAAGGGGAIVNAASVAGLVAWPPAVAYGAAKAGVIQLTRVMAAELAPRSVRVNSYSPAVVESPMVNEFLDRLTPETRELALADLTERNMISRLGRPEEIAELVIFLGSDRASFITGENINIDGGCLAWRGSSAGVQIPE
jgi:NAD(P)-dependent dehydrogenase (short-subunit alcohol dehydrogenase family)